MRSSFGDLLVGAGVGHGDVDDAALAQLAAQAAAPLELPRIQVEQVEEVGQFLGVRPRNRLMPPTSRSLQSFTRP